MSGRADAPRRPTATPPDVPTLDGLLAAQAEALADRVFLRFTDGDLTFAETDARVDAAAADLAALGVTARQLVPVVLPNGADMVVTWFALCRLGAVATLVNTALRGPALVHALDLTTSGVLVTDEGLLPSIVAVDGERAATQQAVMADQLGRAGGRAPAPSHRVTDPAMVIFTSGSTGPSKGCVLSHRYAVRHGQLTVQHFELRPDDVLYSPFPL